MADNVTDKSLDTTIIHEILHTVDGCLNHKAKWQEMANIVNNAYGYNIKRTTSAEEMGVERIEKKIVYHYEIKCTKCNNVWKYQKESKVVKCCRNNNATCPCGARNFVVINL